MVDTKIDRLVASGTLTVKRKHANGGDAAGQLEDIVIIVKCREAKIRESIRTLFDMQRSNTHKLLTELYGISRSRLMLFITFDPRCSISDLFKEKLTDIECSDLLLVEGVINGCCFSTRFMLNSDCKALLQNAWQLTPFTCIYPRVVAIRFLIREGSLFLLSTMIILLLCLRPLQ